MRFLLLGLILYCLPGCVPIPQEPIVHVTTTVLPASLEKLPTPLECRHDEVMEPWKQEYYLGKKFALSADYYRAATCFQRALYLLPDKAEAHSVLVHALILTYSVAGKYDEVISIYEKNRADLVVHDKNLALDCLGLLYEAYSHKDRLQEANSILQIIPGTEEAAKNLPVFQALSMNSQDCFIKALDVSASLPREQSEELNKIKLVYGKSKKHPETAASLNAIIPGAGYLYVNEYQTSSTAFCINVLFAGATWQLLSAHQLAAGLIAGGFEVGWYAGGVMGAYMAANVYNERLREQLVKYYLQKYHLYPLQQLHYQW
jgi:tetratricopeptide (TPR) repeat protein